MSQKMVLFPTFLPEWETALNQLLTFPAGTHDDFVDALAKIGQGLNIMTPAERDAPPPKDKLPYLWEPTYRGLKDSHNRMAFAKQLSKLDK